MSVRTHSPSRSLDRAASKASAAVRGVAFWTSVAVPFAYPPLLAASTVTDIGVSVVAAVVVANALALFVGHGYDPSGDAGSDSGTDRPSEPSEVAE